MYLLMHILVHMCAGAHGVKCSPSNSQEWSCLTVVVSDLMWVLRIKFQSSVKQQGLLAIEASVYSLVVYFLSF